MFTGKNTTNIKIVAYFWETWTAGELLDCFSVEPKSWKESGGLGRLGERAGGGYPACCWPEPSVLETLLRVGLENEEVRDNVNWV